MHYDGLILDFGEVLSYPQQEKDVAAMADVLHVEEARFRDAYWQSRRDYDLGLSADGPGRGPLRRSAWPRRRRANSMR